MLESKKSILLLIILLSYLFSCSKKKKYDCSAIAQDYSVFKNFSPSKKKDVIKKVEEYLIESSSCKEGYILLGELYFDLHEFNLASVNYNKALATYDNIYILFKLGLTYDQLGIYDSAVLCFNKAENMKIKDGFIVTYSDEFSELESIYKKDIDYSQLVLHKAISDYKFGDYYHSLIGFNYCISRKIELNQSYFYRSLIYARINNKEKACLDAQNAIQFGNDSILFCLAKFSIKCQ